MSGGLFHAGLTRPPRDRRRRILLGAVVSLGCVGLVAVWTVGAGDSWRAGDTGWAVLHTLLALFWAAVAVASIVATAKAVRRR